MSEPLLKIENVNRVYEDKETTTQVLHDINLEVRRGEFISIIGSSGCGKTTLLRLIAGLDKPQSGTLSLEGEKITGTSPKRGYVFQQGGLFEWLTVEQNIAAGLKARHIYREKKHRIPEARHPDEDERRNGSRRRCSLSERRLCRRASRSLRNLFAVRP